MSTSANRKRKQPPTQLTKPAAPASSASEPEDEVVSAAELEEEDTKDFEPAVSEPKKKNVKLTPQERKQLRADSKDLGKYINKQRTLVFSTRGIANRDRHLMQDLRDLLPHSKKDAKLDSKDKLSVVNEVAELNNCNNCIFFEARKKRDLYLWVARCPSGPSVKFHVENVHTMAEVKFNGNCLKGSRPILSFDAEFETNPVYKLLKELFTQVFGTPKGHPKAKPFVDHVLSFHIADNRIWFRNYQVVYDPLAKHNAVTAEHLLKHVDATTNSGGAAKLDPVLIEIGPRFVLNPIRVFEGSFAGATLWENPLFKSPNETRTDAKKLKSGRYAARQQAKSDRNKKVEELGLQDTSTAEEKLDNVFR